MLSDEGSLGASSEVPKKGKFPVKFVESCVVPRVEEENFLLCDVVDGDNDD